MTFMSGFMTFEKVIKPTKKQLKNQINPLSAHRLSDSFQLLPQQHQQKSKDQINPAQNTLLKYPKNNVPSATEARIDKIYNW